MSVTEPIHHDSDAGLRQDGTGVGVFRQLFSDAEFATHVCLLYSCESQRRISVSSYVQSALARGDRFLYVVDGEPRSVLGWLNHACASQGVPSGFGIENADRVYCPCGEFVPDAMINQLEGVYDGSLKDGYPGFSGTGEMSWSVRDIPGSERLIEYESGLNRLVTGRKITLLCQYDLNRFDGGLMLDVLKIHPLVLINGQVVRNPLFEMPSSSLDRVDENPVRYRVLGELMLMQSILDFFPGRRKMAEFICRGLLSIPGCEAAALELDGPQGSSRRSNDDCTVIAVEDCRRVADAGEVRRWKNPLVLPVASSAHIYGRLLLRFSGGAIQSCYEPYLSTFVNSVGLVMEHRRHKHDLEQEVERHRLTAGRLENANEQLKILANTDSLTGLFNSRYFFDCAPRDITAGLEMNRPMVLAMIDLNNLKKVNDEMGHNEGNNLLKSFALLCRETLRMPLDKAFRVGGDEFVILMTDCEPAQAEAVCARLNTRFGELNPAASLAYGVVSIPAEVADGGEDQFGGHRLESLLDQADRRMYRNKLYSKSGG